MMLVCDFNVAITLCLMSLQGNGFPVSGRCCSWFRKCSLKNSPLTGPGSRKTAKNEIMEPSIRRRCRC